MEKRKNKETKRNMFTLEYEGKEPEESILRKTTPKIKFLEETNYYFQTENSNENPDITYYLGENENILRWLIDNGYLNRIQLIYIDPPFGTGSTFTTGATVSRLNDGLLAYSDLMRGPNFVEFLRVRLILLRELLSETGLIFVHIDEKYGFEIKIIMDEVFGRNRFVNHISRVASNPKNFRRKGFGSQKDMILVYSKSENFIWNEVTTPFTENDIVRLFPLIDENGERYTTHALNAPGETKDGPTGQPWKGVLPPPGRHWRYPPDVLDQLDEKGLIVWSKNRVPRIKVYAKDHIKKGKRLQDVWEFKDPQKPTYPTQKKNLEMLKVIVQAGSNEGDLVLDAFAGSGTTLIASVLLGRRAIGIDSSTEAIKAFAKRATKEKISPGKSIRILKEVSVHE